MNRMVIKKVSLDESKNECIQCALCETICPEVFEVPEKMRVKDKPDLNSQKKIKEAAELCPVQVIALEYDESDK